MISAEPGPRDTDEFDSTDASIIGRRRDLMSFYLCYLEVLQTLVSDFFRGH
jgi:hypothetical protein